MAKEETERKRDVKIEFYHSVQWWLEVPTGRRQRGRRWASKGAGWGAAGQGMDGARRPGLQS
jgi:hypothetical protein